MSSIRTTDISFFPMYLTICCDPIARVLAQTHPIIHCFPPHTSLVTNGSIVCGYSCRERKRAREGRFRHSRAFLVRHHARVFSWSLPLLSDSDVGHGRCAAEGREVFNLVRADAVDKHAAELGGGEAFRPQVGLQLFPQLLAGRDIGRCVHFLDRVKDLLVVGKAGPAAAQVDLQRRNRDGDQAGEEQIVLGRIVAVGGVAGVIRGDQLGVDARRQPAQTARRLLRPRALRSTERPECERSRRCSLPFPDIPSQDPDPSDVRFPYRRRCTTLRSPPA